MLGPMERNGDDSFHSPRVVTAQITLRQAMMRTDVVRSHVGVCDKPLLCSSVISCRVRVYRRATHSVVARRQVCACSRARSEATVFPVRVLQPGCWPSSASCACASKTIRDTGSCRWSSRLPTGWSCGRISDPPTQACRHFYFRKSAALAR